MSTQSGRDILLKIGDEATPPMFASVMGLRMKSIALNARTIDVTHSDSEAGWRELLGEAGVKSCSLTGAGVFAGSDADREVRAVFFAQSIRRWQVILPGLGRMEGPFLIAALDDSGRHDGEAAWSMSLASAGAITFNPEGS